MSPGRWLPFSAALLLGAIFGLHRIVELDLFQQVAVGRAILSNPSTIGLSNFHYTVPAYSYVADKWLASVVVALVDRLGGEQGLMLYQILLPVLVAAGWFLLFRSFGASRPLATVGVCLAMAACSFRLEPRPDTLSLALLGFAIAVMRSTIRFNHLLWIIPSLFVLWVNLHGYFMVGLLAASAITVAAALGDTAGPAARRGLVLLGLALLSCLLHPQGYKALAWPVSQLWMLKAHPYLREAILEFQPTLVLLHGAGAWRWSLLALAAVSYTALGFSDAGRRAGVRTFAGLIFALPWLVAPPPGLVPWPYRITFALLVAALCEIPHNLRLRRFTGPLILAGFTVLAMPLIRNLSLVPMASLALLTPSWSRAVERLRKPQLAVFLAGAALALVGWARLADHLPAGTDRSPGWTGWGIDRSTLPVSAADFVERAELPGRLLNHFDNGGYLLYRFYPERKVFISGNTSMYPPEFFREFHYRVIGRHADPDSIAREHGIGVAVLDHASPETSILVGKLVGSRNWSILYLDRAAVVFAYNGRGAGESIDLDRRVADLLDGHEAGGALPAWLLPRRRLYPDLNFAHFLRAAGRPDLALKLADMMWRAGPHVTLATFTAAAAEDMADLPLAIPRLRWALNRDRHGRVVRSWLARALYVRAIGALEEDRPQEARTDLLEVLDLSPGEPGALVALARLEASKGNFREAERLLCEAIAAGKDPGVERIVEADPLLAPFLRNCD